MTQAIDISQIDITLETIKIQNFKQLKNIALPLRDLTILVGANASGKTSSLSALQCLKYLLTQPDNLLGFSGIEDKVEIILKLRIYLERYGENKEIEDVAQYTLSFANEDRQISIFKEQLTLDSTDIVSIQDGKGIVQDEDSNNRQDYNRFTKGLALATVANFGKKPITLKIAEFIRKWEFFDLDFKEVYSTPEINPYYSIESFSDGKLKLEPRNMLKVTPHGGRLIESIIDLHDFYPEEFNLLNQEIYESIGIQLKIAKKEGKYFNRYSGLEVKILEENNQTIPISAISDGTFYFIFYCFLLFSPKLPSLVAIEEPERSFHPGLLLDVASVLKRLSKKTQVILTTHSAKLLDCFSLEEIQDDVSVLLLHKHYSYGTQVFPLDELGKNREDILEWMQNFGVGSAVYRSNLLQEFLELQNA